MDNEDPQYGLRKRQKSIGEKSGISNRSGRNTSRGSRRAMRIQNQNNNLQNYVRENYSEQTPAEVPLAL